MAARGQALSKAARRAWPVVLMAWERWQALSPQEKERYKRRARQATDRGRRAIEKQRRK
jgi:hypothetical protein